MLLKDLFSAAIAAADPALRVPPFLPRPPSGRTLVVGAGKASAAMALAVEQHWQGPISGLVITRYGHGAPCRSIEIVEASHPVPDANGRDAALRMGELVKGLTADDLVLCLISGGGSALLAAPAPGLTLEDKQNVNRQLLACGAPISEMNCVRKHLSALKGGRLAAAAWPAQIVSLVISDVPGDDPAVVASGPTVPDPTTREEALAILRKYKFDLPAHVWAFLETPAAETPKPGDPRFAKVRTEMIAAPAQSLAAAAKLARDAGYRVIDLGDRIEGEARDVASAQAAQALATTGPAVILSGGETTVTLKGKGRGGRNAEFALALAIALDGKANISAIAGDTDGIDGSEDNAGAVVTPDSLARARAKGIEAKAFLANNDAYGFFDALGDLVVTGPTRTNVNDFRAILID
ncbi:glycerate kinase [Nordella sp. HKS 07]|uniref:glycerate kinase type-2 family protein n=1 Tax=Nordella sp. HKS 07 TaxID=2712222 RepID=UPI0013E1F881|nr:glycerate kinase [Nordella sp. HKS 07]QIG52096.1 glycerate kinase [Nordella sp. HKS 07]